MDKIMNDPVEQRIKTLELKIEFLENWKNTPFIQVTLPVILSIFLASSWGNFSITSLDKRVDSIEKKMDKLETRMDKLEGRIYQIEQRLDGIESKIDRILALK